MTVSLCQVNLRFSIVQSVCRECSPAAHGNSRAIPIVQLGGVVCIYSGKVLMR
ncbi:hypothetical protein CBL_01594 [Carabus blaptoides fortunei]